MTKQTEALRLALDALQYTMVFNMSGAYAVVDPDKALAAITAIHDALPKDLESCERCAKPVTGSPADVHTCTPLEHRSA